MNGPHAMLHLPQWATVVVRLVLQPRCDAGQLANPGEQTTPHAPSVHVASSDPIHGQSRPQPPQLIGSPSTLVSQPLVALPSQSMNPRTQGVTSGAT